MNIRLLGCCFKPPSDATVTHQPKTQPKPIKNTARQDAAEVKRGAATRALLLGRRVWSKTLWAVLVSVDIVFRGVAVLANPSNIANLLDCVALGAEDLSMVFGGPTQNFTVLSPKPAAPVNTTVNTVTNNISIPLLPAGLVTDVAQDLMSK